MWSRHTKACVQDKKVACSVCGKEYARTQGMKQHMKAKHGADIPEEGSYYICPYCNKGFSVKKTWVEHKPYCSDNPSKKGPYFFRVTGCPAADHPFTRMRNLNFHMSNMHGWKERWAWVLWTQLNECPLVMNEWQDGWPYGRWLVITQLNECLAAGEWVVKWVSLLIGNGGNQLNECLFMAGWAVNWVTQWMIVCTCFSHRCLAEQLSLWGSILLNDVLNEWPSVNEWPAGCLFFTVFFFWWGGHPTG